MESLPPLEQSRPFSDEDTNDTNENGENMMPIEEFKTAVDSGLFTDDDGFGEYYVEITGDEIEEGVKNPSRFEPAGVVDLCCIEHTAATHVNWYNK